MPHLSAPASRELRSRVEISEGDLLVEPAAGDEEEEPLERNRVVTEVHPAVGEVDPQEFEQEALALELAAAPLLARPPFGEPDELREILRIDLLSAANEVQVLPHAGLQPGAVVFANYFDLKKSEG